jgi:branched-chain amino acid transport system ATP-binding protein
MSVLENLMLVPLGQHGENVWKVWFWNNAVIRQEDDIRRRAESILELVGLTPLRFHDPMQLSGGQKKLLELARSLMSEPHMVLLDEPSAGVNPTLARQLFDHIRSIRDQRGVTFLLIEHDMAAIARMCDWVIVMAEGRVLIEGTPDQVRNDDRVLEAYLGRRALATG